MLAILGIILLCGTASAQPMVAVEITMVAADGLATHVPVEEAVLRLAPVTGTGLAPLEATLAVPGTVTIDLPQGTLWTATLSADSWWAPPTTVNADSSPPPVTAWPLAAVTAEVEAPPHEPLPASVHMHFVGTGTMERQRVGGEGSFAFEHVLQDAEPRGVVDCPLAEGRLRCLVPAALLDLKLRAGGFASVLRWGQTVAWGQELHLGRVTLVPGGSLLGRVVTAEGPVDRSRCEVRLRPAPVPEAGPPYPAALAERARKVERTRPDQRGYFSFEGLATGAFLVEVEHQGFAMLTTEPLPVFERQETELVRTLVLERPVDLHIQVTPPTAAENEQWTVVGVAADGHARGSGVFRERADQDGRLVVRGLAPAILEVTLGSRSGNVVQQEFVLSATSRHLFLEFAGLEVCGTVLEGEDPIPGAVFFGGRGGLPGVRLEADDEGRFRGLLPRAGSWAVQVINDHLGLDAMVPEILVRERPGRCDEVEVRIPGGQVFGTVVDESGLPVDGARVLLLDASRTRLATRESDPEGGFAFRGVTNGPGQLFAEDHRGASPRESATVDLDVPTDGRVGPVVLQLDEKQEVTGVVLGDGKPLPGAHVSMMTDWAIIGAAQTETANTDATGRFRIRVRKGAARALVTVFAPPFALAVQSVALTQGSDIAVPVTTAAGSLDVVVERDGNPGDETPGTPPGASWSLWVDGLPLTRSHLLQWCRLLGVPHSMTGGEWTIPRLAPGHYRACRFASTEDFLAVWSGGMPAGVVCSSGFLPAGGTLRLAL